MVSLSANGRIGGTARLEMWEYHDANGTQSTANYIHIRFYSGSYDFNARDIRLLSAAAKDMKQLPSQWNPRLKFAVQGLLHFLVLGLRMLIILFLPTYHIGWVIALILRTVSR